MRSSLCEPLAADRLETHFGGRVQITRERSSLSDRDHTLVIFILKIYYRAHSESRVARRHQTDVKGENDAEDARLCRCLRYEPAGAIHDRATPAGSKRRSHRHPLLRGL